MFLIDSVDEKHVFASAGNLATPGAEISCY